MTQRLRALSRLIRAARRRLVVQPGAERSKAEHSVPDTHRIKNKWFDQTFAEVPHDDEQMRFATTGSSSVKRIRSLFDKEPITLAWIDSFDPNEVMFDIGANVGMYTIYAAVMRKAQVFAFEPEALNYAELNKNIFLNDLHGQVLAYCLALSDVDKTDRLLLSDFGLGISYHDFEENSWSEDKQFAPDWKVSRHNRKPQGCMGRRVDSLLADGLPVPAHIKIDVDGLEHRVIEGMLETLKQPGVKTVLMEVNFDNSKNLDAIEKMTSLGWKFSWDQLKINRHVRFTEEQIKKAHRKAVGGMNYIFYKDNSYDEYFKILSEQYIPGTPINTKDILQKLDFRSPYTQSR
ncbi:FkbM family methyltransferase [Sphingobium sp. B2D3A]|uniref:FkbM family methyltransferase n=1 Tax=unclassified Sphingobium TaxID=2611147 RepID=UPI00222501B8|nr:MULTISPECIES: FkbM family methyltransferase [unclassified Sphingobium]MCW2338516.1 FkbM family methyltransferase [Sphingobium sp. B2D3A]MCW2384974.1 FkbM family methyltransferase [Sphingobium sp. B2D3D]